MAQFNILMLLFFLSLFRDGIQEGPITTIGSMDIGGFACLTIQVSLAILCGMTSDALVDAGLFVRPFWRK